MQKKNLNKIVDSEPYKKEIEKPKVFKFLDAIKDKDKNKSKKEKIKKENKNFKANIRKNKGKRMTENNGPPPKQKKVDVFDKRSSFIINNANSNNKIMDLITKDEELKFGYSVKCLKRINAKKIKDKKINKKSKFHDIFINNKKNNNNKVAPNSSSGLIKIERKRNLDKVIKYINNGQKYNSQELNDLTYD